MTGAKKYPRAHDHKCPPPSPSVWAWRYDVCPSIAHEPSNGEPLVQDDRDSSRLALPACIRVPGGIAPSNIPLSQGGYTVLGPTVAQDCKINLFGVLAISGGNHVADAVRNALPKFPAAMLL